MQERSGKEETADGGGRVVGQHRGGLWDLQENTWDGGDIQVPGAGDDGGWWQLAGSGGKLGESTEELETAVTYFEPGRGRQEGIGKFLQGGGAGGTTVWGGDVGADPTNGKGAGQLYAQVREKDNGDTAAERVGE